MIEHFFYLPGKLVDNHGKKYYLSSRRLYEINDETTFDQIFYDWRKRYKICLITVMLIFICMLLSSYLHLPKYVAISIALLLLLPYLLIIIAFFRLKIDLKRLLVNRLPITFIHDKKLQYETKKNLSMVIFSIFSIFSIFLFILIGNIDGIIGGILFSLFFVHFLASFFVSARQIGYQK